jgi:hypothetical protein
MNVAELIKDHVTLTVDCVDRVYLNADVPGLHSSGGVVRFLHPLLPAHYPTALRIGLQEVETAVRVMVQQAKLVA